MLFFILFFIFMALSTIYYSTTLSTGEFSNLFLSISTFLFAIFTGFFISRQGQRYSSIRNQIATFDGMMSTFYRNFVYFGKAIQTKAKNIIENHYKIILKNQAWDYHFNHKSDTIIKLNELLLEAGRKKDDGSGLSVSFLREAARMVRDLQIIRKKMILLHQEDVPKFQWVLLIFLAIILLISVSMIPSQAQFMGSILKGAFGTCVVLILVLLRRFDDLNFFESTIGENSAQDILDIIKGKK
jgi:hypothetical protein